MNKLHIPDTTGHTTMEWSAENKIAIKDAEEKFNDLKLKGYTAVDTSDKDNWQQIGKFNENSKEITMIPLVTGG